MVLEVKHYSIPLCSYEFAYARFSHKDRLKVYTSEVSRVVNPIWYYRTWLTYG